MEVSKFGVGGALIFEADDFLLLNLFFFDGEGIDKVFEPFEPFEPLEPILPSPFSDVADKVLVKLDSGFENNLNDIFVVYLKLYESGCLFEAI